MEQHVWDIIAAGQRLAQLGLVQAQSGNISCRLADGSILITAAGKRKGELIPADVLRLDEQGEVLPSKERVNPSSESGLHVALYAAREDIAAIVHAHPPYATALASAGRRLDWQLLEEGRLFLGPVPLLPQLAAGSAELARAAACDALYAAELPQYKANALLLANHGVVSWGETLQEALSRMEIIEHIARVMLYTSLYKI